MTVQRSFFNMTGSASANTAEAACACSFSGNFYSFLIMGAALAAPIFISPAIIAAGIGAQVLLVCVCCRRPAVRLKVPKLFS